MPFLHKFFALEAASGIVLLAVSVLALVAANSPLVGLYIAYFQNAVVTHAINDGLMAIFFLLIGMEIKRELVTGELKGFRRALLPVAGAAGGVILPALIYLHFNGGTEAARGWAIPTATDIAFSLGILALLGSRVPFSLKVFLMAVAVIDDLIAILIIAFFYTQGLELDMLAASVLMLCMLILMNRFRVRIYTPYLLVGTLMWWFVLKSGIHATVAGVLLGFCIPLGVNKSGEPMSVRLEKILHPWVAFGILPLFAFANAGVQVPWDFAEFLTKPLPLGITLGLFFGKQIGIFSACALLILLGVAKKPEGGSWPQLYGVCMLAGIGFTMSLFIGNLAFNQSLNLYGTRVGVIIGSLCSAVFGYIFLRVALLKSAAK